MRMRRGLWTDRWLNTRRGGIRVTGTATKDFLERHELHYNRVWISGISGALNGSVSYVHGISIVKSLT